MFLQKYKFYANLINFSFLVRSLITILFRFLQVSLHSGFYFFLLLNLFHTYNLFRM